MVELKIKAIAEMKSQAYSPDYARKVVETMNGKDGVLNGIAYAESFIKVTQDIDYYLPISEERIKRDTDARKLLNGYSKLIAPFVKVEEE